MKDKQKKYLDKVVEFLVKGTTIDFNSRKISYPFVPLSSPLPPRLPLSLFPSLPPSLSSLPFLFSTYVRDMYGLTREESDYVWERYKTNILDKIDNGR